MHPFRNSSPLPLQLPRARFRLPLQKILMPFWAFTHVEKMDIDLKDLERAAYTPVPKAAYDPAQYKGWNDFVRKEKQMIESGDTPEPPCTEYDAEVSEKFL